MWKNPNLYLLKKKVSKKYMLNKLKQTKIKLMKDRRNTKERLNKLTGTAATSPTDIDGDVTLKHQLTLQINGINTVVTEFKNFAVKHKLPSEESLTLENQVDVLKAVLKSLDKEMAAYDKDHSKYKDAQFTKTYLKNFIPEEFRPASTEEMDNFIKEAKESNLDFKSIMAKAKQYKNFDMKYISQAARN